MFLGQYVARDENLFYFIGDSINIRQVISKPDKIGLWFYELCCRVRNGEHELPYLMHLFLHDSELHEVTTASVVEKWVNTMWSVGKETVPECVNPHPKCILDMDSYYIGSESRNFLIMRGQKFLASCSKERFKSEVSFVHRHNEADK